MNLDYILKIWPIILLFLSASVAAGHFIAKLFIKLLALKQHIDSEKELFAARLEAVKKEAEAEQKLLMQRITTL